MIAVGIDAGLTVDHVVTVGHEARFYECGGPGWYAALGAHLVAGVQPVLAAALPDDDPRFRDALASRGIDLRYAWGVPAVPRVWILNAPEGRRIVSAEPPLGTELEVSPTLDGSARTGSGGVGGHAEAPPRSPENRDDERAVSAQMLAGLDGLLRSSPERVLPDGPVAPVVGVDPHQILMAREGLHYLRRVMPAHGGVCLPSRVHLRAVSDDPERAAVTLARQCGVPVVARLDVDGMVVVDTEAEHLWRVTDPAVTVRETTGAGDASAAAIVAALARGYDVVTAARFGTSVARIALSDWGAAGLLASDPVVRPFVEVQVEPVSITFDANSVDARDSETQPKIK